jgi:hypothetical protein
MTYKELIARLPEELQTEIRLATTTALKSVCDAYHARKRQELEDQEREHQQILEEVERWFHGESTSDDSPEVPQAQEPTTPSRREMVLAVLPEFRDRDFIRRDVEAKIIERWPEIEPKSKRERKNFTTAIASVMTDQVKKGQLEVEEGESRFEPRVYRVKDI